MSNSNDSRFENVYSKKVKAGSRRTYFFDVRKTRGEDYYITITKSLIASRLNGKLPTKTTLIAMNQVMTMRIWPGRHHRPLILPFIALSV